MYLRNELKHITLQVDFEYNKSGSVDLDVLQPSLAGLQKKGWHTAHSTAAQVLFVCQHASQAVWILVLSF